MLTGYGWVHKLITSGIGMYRLTTSAVGVYKLITSGVGIYKLITSGVWVYKVITSGVGVYRLTTPGVGYTSSLREVEEYTSYITLSPHTFGFPLHTLQVTHRCTAQEKLRKISTVWPQTLKYAWSNSGNWCRRNTDRK